jgi:hypothetical protein
MCREAKGYGPRTGLGHPLNAAMQISQNDPEIGRRLCLHDFCVHIQLTVSKNCDGNTEQPVMVYAGSNFRRETFISITLHIFSNKPGRRLFEDYIYLEKVKGAPSMSFKYICQRY